MEVDPKPLAEQARSHPYVGEDAMEGIELGSNPDQSDDSDSANDGEDELIEFAEDASTDASDASDDEEPESDADGGVPVSTGRAVSPSAIPFSTAAESQTVAGTVDLNPQKPIPYILDTGNMLISDPNPLPPMSSSQLEPTLASAARDAAQTLLNNMLTTCPIQKAPTTSTSSSGITMTLPKPDMQLPREKKVPEPKPPTKWEQFAAKKGISKGPNKGTISKNGELRSTEGKMVYDESKGDWVPRYGYKGRNKGGENDWLVEVDDKKETQGGVQADSRTEGRAARKERIRRNERMQRANEKKARRGKAG